MIRNIRTSRFPGNENRKPVWLVVKKKSFPLHKAIQYQNIHKIKILLPEIEDVNERNDDGNTILHLACEQDNVEILQLVLAHKEINVTAINRDKFTALHILAFRGNLEGIVKVMNKCPTINIEAVNDKGNTPLIMASKTDHVDVIEYLHSKGASVNHKNDKRFTALHYAANSGYSEMVEMLIKLGADRNAQDDYGLTPLMKACKWSFVRCCQILLEKGADVNFANKSGQTALKSACFRDYVEVVKLLIKHKANVNYPGSYSTALFECAKRGNVACAKELISAGAKVTGKIRSGRSVLDMAEQNRHADFVEFVRKYFE